MNEPNDVFQCARRAWLWHNATNSSYPRLSTVYNRPLSFNKTIAKFAIGFECIYEPEFYHITTFEWTVTHSDDGLLLQTQGKDRFLQYYFEEPGDYVVKCRAWFDIENWGRCENMTKVPITFNGTHITYCSTLRQLLHTRDGSIYRKYRQYIADIAMSVSVSYRHFGYRFFRYMDIVSVTS